MRGADLPTARESAVTSRARSDDLRIEEELAGASLERSVWSRFLPLLAEVRGRLAVVLVLELVLVGLVFLRPWLLRTALDQGLLRAAGAVTLVPAVLACCAAALAATWLVRFALGGVSQFLSGSAALAVLSELRAQLFSHVQKLDVRYFDRAKAGRIVARVDRDVDSLEPLLIQGPPELLSAVLRCLVSGVLLLQLSPALCLSVLWIVPVLGPATWLFQRLAARNYARVAERRSAFTAHLVESVAGVRILQQTGQEERNRSRYRDLVYAFNHALVSGNRQTGWYQPLTGLLAAVGMAALLHAGAHEIAASRLTLGQLAQGLFYVFLFLGPLQELGDLFDRYSTGAASAQRLFLLLDTRPAIVDAPGALTLGRVRGDVELDAVTFSYDPRRRPPVLHQLSLRIPAGQVLAVIGRTGHGKSTLVQLLTRFYEPQEGAVRIDGHDLRQVTQHSLRKNIGVVLQDNVLFSGTILDNLRLARPGAPDDTLIAGAGELGADELIARLPAGYHTEVGPAGSHLSHGQRQLVCLVRAYLADPAVLVLDEATSAIDMQTERRLQHALRRLCAGRTAILIAHRLATIRDVDRIAVLRHGRLVELGTHDELLAIGGAYAELLAAHERGESDDRAA